MRKICCIVLLLFAVMGMAACGNAAAPSPSQTQTATASPQGALAGWTIAVDAGHGGIDNGCVSEKGTTEAQLNLQIAYALKAELEAEDALVVMTRTDDDVNYDDGVGDTRKQKDMSARLDVIEGAKADLVLSIHLNKYSDARVRGAQTFYDGEDPQGRSLAFALQEVLNALPEQVKKRSAMAGNYFILKTPGCPGALVECGFLSNPEEESLLLAEDYRRKLAQALCRGVVEYCRNGQNG